METKSGCRLIPDPKVGERYGVTTETLDAWEKDPKVKFPAAIRIRYRKYRDEQKLDEFDAKCAAEQSA